MVNFLIGQSRRGGMEMQVQSHKTPPAWLAEIDKAFAPPTTTRAERLTSFITLHRAAAKWIFTARREHRSWVQTAQIRNPGMAIFYPGNALGVDLKEALRHRRLVNKARRDLRAELASQALARAA